ncbi:MAG: hypothetical protein DRN81_04215 [Thermoproteota archaeon]|nr:MAG: hypothetical protein DRN81_04215 [Candidatus Korarchaeota archaeon]
MGKIKGWTQKRNLKTEVTNDTLIYYESDNSGNHLTVASVNKKGIWFVVGRNFSSVNFKKRTDALTFAINYMRRHPRG